MRSNIHPVTGIRYGVINANSVNPYALDDILSQGVDETYESLCTEIKEVVEDELANLSSYGPSYNLVDAVFYRLKDVLPYSAEFESDLIELVNENGTEHSHDMMIDWIENKLSESYEAQDTTYIYKKDGYIILFFTGTNELMVLESPYTAKVRLCSPCAPNAGDLDSPDPHGYETYALGPDWFEEA